MLAQQLGHISDGHLLAKQHRHRFKHEREPAAGPRPRHFDLPDAVFFAPTARHFGHQPALVLEEIEVPPAPLDGVMHRAAPFAVRAFPVQPARGLQLEDELFGLSLQSAFGDFPVSAQSKG